MIIWRRVWMVAGSLAAAAGLYFALQPTPPEKVLLRFLEQDYPKAKEVTMYSLGSREEVPREETPNVEQVMGYDVLGKVTLTDSHDREDGRLGMLETVKSANQEVSTLHIVEPQHAFRITTQDLKIVTIVLFYETCYAAFDGLGGQDSGCNITSDGLKRLNALQDKHKLPRGIPGG